MSHPSLLLKAAVVTASDPLIAHTETLSATVVTAANERAKFLGCVVSAGSPSGTATFINVTLEILWGAVVKLSATARFYNTRTNRLELFSPEETYLDEGVMGDDLTARVTVTGAIGTDTLDNLHIALFHFTGPVFA
jgi:hypothetical protein